MGNLIRITQGYGIASFNSGGEFLFDIADLQLIQSYTWHLGKRGYPATHVGGKTVVLHRLFFPNADGEIDHINGDKLDNRRANLRVCTHQQNAFNQQRRNTNTSGYIGVSAVRGKNRYEAYIHLHGHKYHLGLFSSASQAARVRDCVSRLVYGEYARLNFPNCGGRRHGKR